MDTVVVLSGGLDSVVLAYLVKAQGQSALAISVDYGQRHAKELAYARLTADRLGMPWRLLDLTAAGIGGLLAGSSLTDEAVPVASAPQTRAGNRSHVVPNRNALMLALAYTAAATANCRRVAIAVSGTDRPTPDCRPEFLLSFEAMETLALDGLATIELFAPFVRRTKEDVVRIGAELGVPWTDTWSCYQGGIRHCGRCLACTERREAFAAAGVADPTDYEDSADDENRA